jgi:hypothetical protein
MQPESQAEPNPSEIESSEVEEDRSTGMPGPKVKQSRFIHAAKKLRYCNMT